MGPPSLRPRWQSVATVLALVGGSFAVLLFASPDAAALTYVAGEISSDTVWDLTGSPYVIVGHVLVRPGVSLTIMPGTTVRFNAGQALYVEGRFQANGFPGNEISFVRNNTMIAIPPQGIQFNASSSGSVSWSFIDRMDRGVTAIDSSPDIQDNFIDHAFMGVALGNSLANVARNAINDTQWAIYAIAGGAPFVSSNLITNVTGNFPVGIYVTSGAAANLWFNAIVGVAGRSPGNAGVPGAPGAAGSAGIGILVDGAPWATIQQNAIDSVYGGRGGDGMNNPGGTGGRGGDGGGAAGIVIGGTSSVDLGDNTITNVNSGRGGNGGGSVTTSFGGDGGVGGTASAIQAIAISSDAAVSRSWIDGVRAGSGGNGGDGATDDGAGGNGGESYGVLPLAAMNWDATGNTIQNLLGGFGGNSTNPGTGNNAGGMGGPATGIAVSGVANAATLHSNTVMSLSGGPGGRGAIGGSGGNATGAFAVGDGNFNATSVTGNWVQDLTAGNGGLGFRNGGNGGSAAGYLSGYVTPYFGSNGVWSVQGGDGGDAIDGTNGGRGGDAVGEGYFMVPSAWSASAWINTITKGAAGFGPPIQASFASGYFVEGSSSMTSQLIMENATLFNVEDRDIWISNDAIGTTINTPFQSTKLMVEATSTLYVMNYLSTSVYWSDGFTPVSGANVVVTEDGSVVWNITSATGFDQWLLTLDRYYPGSTSATDVLNVVGVSYLTYTFGSNPRTVDMASGQVETFVMDDGDAPTSTAGVLPVYTGTFSFDVNYTATDGNGTGLDTITLWYRRDGGAWTAFGTQFAGPMGWFAFTAPGDGTYEFETVATDTVGNVEAGPATNESWTIVDTTRPLSAVNTLPLYENTFSFSVSWAPDPGVTDIVSYTVQFNRGFGWTNWLVNTPQSSGTFTAVSQGVYQFRSIARDGAGNVEIVAGNDTYTLVDTIGPSTFATALPKYQTSLTFPVAWEAESDDVASFRIDVRDNGVGWNTWILSTTLLTADYTGQDGHTYEYRAVGTDFAGNVESQPAGNESWTIVDTTLPLSLVASLPTYRTSLQFTVAWAPEAGVTDIASYRIDVNDDSTGWTTWIATTTTTSASFTGQDGHKYEFRSIARDAAGNAEGVPPTADSSTTVDTTPPTTTGTPSGTIGNNNWYTTAVLVTLAATDATSGLASISYRVDAGPWQTYTSQIGVAVEGRHTVEYQATDNASNVENVVSLSLDIDLSPPVSSATLLGTQGDNNWMTTPVAVTLSATDTASGVASGEYRIDGGSWTGYTGAFSVAADGGHTVDFRATDNAGLTETAKTVTFRIDQQIPLVVTTAPRGTDTNTTPRIVITFSEAMNRTSVEIAFSITPDVSGIFAWNANSTSVTFTPDQTLQPGTAYFISLSQSAKDMAGNPLPQTTTYQFTTVATAPGNDLEVGYLWWLLIAIAAVLGSLFVLRSRLPVGTKTSPAAAAEPKKEEQATIDDVFLLYHDGILIKHETRRLKPDIDTDILSGMLTAVQSFVKDTFRSEEGHLDEMTFGEMHILIGRGKWIILAAMIRGEGTDSMAKQMQKCIEEMEAHHAQVIEAWDGNMTLARVLSPYISKMIRGEYISSEYLPPPPPP